MDHASASRAVLVSHRRLLDRYLAAAHALSGALPVTEHDPACRSDRRHASLSRTARCESRHTADECNNSSRREFDAGRSTHHARRGT